LWPWYDVQYVLQAQWQYLFVALRVKTSVKRATPLRTYIFNLHWPFMRLGAILYK
jgi:hypothetical protein